MFRRQLFERLVDAPVELGADGLIVGVVRHELEELLQPNFYEG